MKNILSLILIFTQIFIVTPSRASITEPDRQQLAYRNELTNGSFQNKSARWTASSGTLSTDTTNFIDGTQSGLLTMSASTGNLQSNVTPAAQYSGVQMESSCYVKTSLATVSFCAMANGVETQCQSVPATNVWTPMVLNFNGPTNGQSIGVEIKSTSTTGTYNVSGCYTGRARGIGQVAQAVQLGSVKIAGNGQSFTNATNSFANYSANASMNTPTVTGSCTSTGKTPSCTFSSMGSGDYYFVATARFLNQGGTNAVYRFTDGTNSSSGQLCGTGSCPTIAGRLSYSTPQTSSTTIQIQGKNGGAGSGDILTATDVDFEMMVYYFPSSTSMVINPNITPGSWSGTQVGVGGGWATTSATYADFSVATTSNTLTQLTASNVSCSAESTKLAGVTCTLPRIGRYNVCATGTLNGSGATANMAVRLVDGSTTIINGGELTNAAAGGINAMFNVCGQYNAASVASAITFKIQGLAGSSVTTSIGESTNTPITWSIIELDAAMPSPLLAGNVTNNSTSSYRLETAYVSTQCTSSPCTIASKSSTWLTSITRVSTGVYTLDIPSGTFSATPACVFTIIQSTGYPIVMYDGTTLPTATSIKYHFYDTNTGGDVPADEAFSVMCMGPR